jgi:hypothetical protein
MKNRGKNYLKASEKIEKGKLYSKEEAVLISLYQKYVCKIDELKRRRYDNEQQKIEAIRMLAADLSGFFGSYHNAFYWLVLKDKGVEFNIEDTLKKWNEIAEKVFGSTDMSNYYMCLFNENKKEIIEVLRK